MIRPIRNQVLLRPYPSEEKSVGGIIVSEAHREVNNKMVVVAVGEGVPGKPMQLKPGDTVFRVLNWGQPIQEGEVVYYLMAQESLLAKL